jgi:hypothetical protein
MLHTINLNEYNLNNCKFIVIKNNTDIDFNYNNNIIKPKQEIFKKFINEKLTLETDQCRMTTTGIFAQDLKDWRDAFNRQIGALIDQFLTFSTNILTGSPIKG